MIKDFQWQSLWAWLRSPSTIIVTLVLSIILCVFGLLGWKAWEAREATLARSAGDAQNLAHSLAQHASRTIESAGIVLDGVIERLLHDGYRADQFERMNNLLAMRAGALPQIRELVVLDNSGRWIFSSVPSLPTYDNSDRDYFLFHRGDPDLRLRVNNPLKSRLTGRWTILLTRRVNTAEGTFAGVVAAAIDLDYFQRFYNSFDIGDKGNIGLFRDDGTLLVRRPFDADKVGRDLSAMPLFDHMARARAGYYRVTSSLDGDIKGIAYEHLADFPIVVSVALAEATVLAGWRSGIRTDFIVAALLSVVFAFLGMLAAVQFRLRAKAEAILQQSESRYRLLADNAGDVVVRLGLDGVRRYVSPAMQDVLGWTPQELIGSCAFHLAHPAHREDLEKMIEAMAHGQENGRLVHQSRRKDGSYVWVESSFKLVREEETHAPSEIIVVLRDITQRKAVEEELQAANAKLQTLAATDALTGLANRRSFDFALNRECRRATRSGQPLSILFVDIDMFKSYNDRWGHQAGDECLRQVAGAIMQALQRPGDLVARYGGEEFAVILPDTDEHGAALVAEKLRCSVAELAIRHPGNTAHLVTISIGVSSAILHREGDGDSLLRGADEAVYRAKRNGRNRVVCFSEIAPVRSRVA